MLPPQVPLPAEQASQPGLEVFEVFRQEKEGDPMRHAGSVLAPDADLALHYAREFFARRQESHRLWVVPRREIRELDDPDLLDPPLDRLYKKPGGYVMRDKLAEARGRSGVEGRTASTGRTTKGVDETAEEQAAEAQPAGERAPEAEA